MEILWAGSILTPKRPIATMRYWLGLQIPLHAGAPCLDQLHV